MSEASLDIISEDPEVPHVEEDVGETSVEELRGDERYKRCWLNDAEMGGEEGPLADEHIEIRGCDFQEEHRCIHNDEADRDDRNAFARLVVAEGEHTSRL